MYIPPAPPTIFVLQVFFSLPLFQVSLPIISSKVKTSPPSSSSESTIRYDVHAQMHMQHAVHAQMHMQHYVLAQSFAYNAGQILPLYLRNI